MDTADSPTTNASAWIVHLSGLGSDLDMHDTEDRGAFRCRVEAAFAAAKITVVRDVASALGATRRNSRARTCRAVADAMIARIQRMHANR